MSHVETITSSNAQGANATLTFWSILLQRPHGPSEPALPLIQTGGHPVHRIFSRCPRRCTSTLETTMQAVMPQKEAPKPLKRKRINEHLWASHKFVFSTDPCCRLKWDPVHPSAPEWGCPWLHWAAGRCAGGHSRSWARGAETATRTRWKRTSAHTIVRTPPRDPPVPRTVGWTPWSWVWGYPSGTLESRKAAV